MTITIAHIINPVKVDNNSDLSIAQPITFRTMLNAKQNTEKDIKIKQYATAYEEDLEIIPDHLTITKNLNRSIMDEHNFQHPRKLPLIYDILLRLYESATEAEYLIYTNVDIALMPNFYNKVVSFIHNGYDGFMINKKIIPKKYAKSQDEILFNCSERSNHLGHDCFIFKRDVFPKYKLGKTFIGINWFDEALKYNIKNHAKKFGIFKNENITFHIGNDKVWENKKNKELREFNKQEFRKLNLT